MMKLNFLESGIDSLKKGFEQLAEYERLQFNSSTKTKNRKRLFHLKDAILFIQHGTEILFKQLISKHSEYLLFSQIDENVKKAFRERNEKKLKSVFAGQFKHKLHTVSFTESIERVKILPKVRMSTLLERKVRELELYRNIIMHSETYLEESDVNGTFDGLAAELDLFFYSSLGKSYKTISGYGKFVTSFKIFQDQLKKNNCHLKAESNEAFYHAAQAAKIIIAQKEVIRITDIDICTKFISTLFSHKLTFGIDLCNGHCWGRVDELIRIREKTFLLSADDKMVRYEFDLRSIILFFPSLDDNDSPVLFIESEDMDPIHYKPIGVPENDYNKIKTLEYLSFKESGRIIAGAENVGSFYDSPDEKDEGYQVNFAIFDKGLFCFMNVQGLKYNLNYRRITQSYRTMDGKDFEVILRDSLKV